MKDLKIKMLSVLFLFVICCKKDSEELPVEESSDLKYTTEAGFTSSGLIIHDMIFDSDNTLWLATSGGLYSLAGAEWRHYTDEELASEITALAHGPEAENTIYIGSNSGVDIVSGTDGAYQLTKHFSSSDVDLVSDSITFIEVGPENNIWYGTQQGLSYFDGNQWVEEAYVGLQQSYVTSIGFSGHSYFIGTYGDALYKCYFDPSVDAVSGATQLRELQFGILSRDSIHCNTVDSDDYLWFGTSAGLTQYKDVSGDDFAYHLFGEKIISVYESADGNTWAGTNTGVSKYNGTDWIHYDQGDGIANNTVNCIIDDGAGTVWIGTNNGISSYNGTTWTTY